MTTAEEKIRAEYETKLANAKLEDKILAALPSPPRFVHVGHLLYGTVASVKYEKAPSYSAPSVTLADAVALVEALPPVRLSLIKDGCTSIQPTSYVEALPEATKERWDEESQISPVYVEIEPAQVSLHWVTEIPGAGLVRIAVIMGYPTIGSYRAKRTEYMGGFKYGPATFAPKPELHTIMDGPEPVAQLESPIRWASGGPEYPGRITLYFVDLGADMDPTRVGTAIVRHLAGIK